MSIDPSIPLSFRSPQIQDPMQSLGQMMNLRAFQQENQQRALVSEKQRRALKAQEALQNAIAARNGDYDEAIKDLERGGYGDVAMDVRTSLYDQRTKFANELKITLDNRSASFTQASQLLQGVATPEDYARVLPEVRSLAGPDLATQIPEAFDPAFVAQAVQWGMKASDVSSRLSAAAASLNAGINAKKEGRDSDKDFTEALAIWLPKVGSQQEWDQALEAERQSGASLGVLAKFGTQYSPEAAQRAAQFGAPAPSYQAKDAIIGGQSVVAAFDPRTGTMTPIPGARPIPPASAASTTQTADDTDRLAQMLVDGRIVPSTLSKRAGTYNATLASADRLSQDQTGKKIDLNQLQMKYESAKRFVASMNSNQMVRFKGLAGSVVNTIDEVRRLGEELKQGGVQLYNRAKRNSILQVYGNTPESAVAAQYVGAVNTLKEEFANLAQGGYAPTEAAWALANQQVNGDFGVKDLNASLVEVQRLINYRIGAFDELQPFGGGGSMVGGAAPAAAPASGGIAEGTQRPIPGIPGGMAEYRGGKWIRVK